MTLWQNSQTTDGATLRRWVAEEYAASAEINRPLLERKARYAGLANVALLIEGILIAFAAAAALYGWAGRRYCQRISIAVGGGKGFGVRIMTLDGPGGGIGRVGSGRVPAGGVCFMANRCILTSLAATCRTMLLHYYNVPVQQGDPVAAFQR